MEAKEKSYILSTIGKISKKNRESTPKLTSYKATKSRDEKRCVELCFILNDKEHKFDISVHLKQFEKEDFLLLPTIRNPDNNIIHGGTNRNSGSLTQASFYKKVASAFFSKPVASFFGGVASSTFFSISSSVYTNYTSPAKLEESPSNINTWFYVQILLFSTSLLYITAFLGPTIINTFLEDSQGELKSYFKITEKKIKRGQLDDATRDLTKLKLVYKLLVKSDPYCKYYFNYLWGFALEKHGHHDKAESYYESALSICPEKERISLLKRLIVNRLAENPEVNISAYGNLLENISTQEFSRFSKKIYDDFNKIFNLLCGDRYNEARQKFQEIDWDSLCDHIFPRLAINYYQLDGIFSLIKPYEENDRLLDARYSFFSAINSFEKANMYIAQHRKELLPENEENISFLKEMVGEEKKIQPEEEASEEFSFSKRW